MKNDSSPTPDASPLPWLGMAGMLGAAAVLACGIPFVPPLVFVAVPLAGLGLGAVFRVASRARGWTTFHFACEFAATALNLFAVYLALGHHHLIDWLEGH
jgi:hypothetical protein